MGAGTAARADPLARRPERPKGAPRPLKDALVVDDDPVALRILEKMLGRLGYAVTTAPSASRALKHIARRVPEVILTDILMPGMDGKSFCRRIRQDTRTSEVPLMMISTESREQECLEGFRAGADDYITKPFHVPEVAARLERLVGRNQRAVSSNPLSRLPGNPSIEAEVNRRLEEEKPFAFAYIDIDDFKSYNDVYGFQAGDRVIKDLSRMLTSAVAAKARRGFVGHVGGDDFVVIAGSREMRPVVAAVLRRFDRAAGGYYSAADRRRGGVITADRKHQRQFFPVMKLTCAVVDTATSPIGHYVQLVEIASELKHHLKTMNRRRGSRAQWNGRTTRQAVAKRHVPPHA